MQGRHQVNFAPTEIRRLPQNADHDPQTTTGDEIDSSHGSVGREKRQCQSWMGWDSPLPRHHRDHIARPNGKVSSNQSIPGLFLFFHDSSHRIDNQSLSKMYAEHSPAIASQLSGRICCDSGPFTGVGVFRVQSAVVLDLHKD